MKRKDTSGWLFMALVLIASIVCVISLTQGAKLINPYENWIETKDLKSCEISFVIDAVYSDSMYGEDDYIDYQAMRFENGEFDSASNTFSALNTTERCYEGFDGTTYKETSEKKCQITFDPGANNILSFSASEMLAIVGPDKDKDSWKSEISIKGSGPYFPMEKEFWTSTDGIVWVEDTNNTSYFLWEPEETRKYIKDIQSKITSVYKIDDKYETYTRALKSFKFDNESTWIGIVFNGYLPRLRDSKGNCSWFGGKNDTGIDVKLRKDFYEEYIGGTYDSTAFKRKEFSDKFDEWMNQKPRSEWEGTGLDCGKARELDTNNDYFCAVRWHDKETEKYNVPGKPGSKDWWREQKIKVTNTANNKSVIVAPVDWGPHVDTNRVIDLSKIAMETLRAGTDTTIVEICIVDSDTPLGLATNQ